jgi:thioredoxin 1
VACIQMMPQVEALAQKYEDKVKIAKVEAPKNRRLCMDLRVMALPTFLVFKEGKEVERLSGNVSAEMVENSIGKL